MLLLPVGLQEQLQLLACVMDHELKISPEAREGQGDAQAVLQIQGALLGVYLALVDHRDYLEVLHEGHQIP